MRQPILGGAAILMLAGVVAALPALRTADGPPPGFSGGFGEPSCAACHFDNDVNAFGGRVLVEGLPDAYEAGKEYVLTVRLEAGGTAVAGFEVTARFSEGASRERNAGILRSLDQRSAVTDSAGISYLHHTRAGSVATDDTGSSWALQWIAPKEGGAVTINVAANSGNADSSPLGDLVFTTEVTLPPALGGIPLPSRESPR